MTEEEFIDKLATDDEFRRRFAENPKEVLREVGAPQEALDGAPDKIDDLPSKAAMERLKGGVRGDPVRGWYYLVWGDPPGPRP